MPLPEGYLPREGDVLILHGRVVYNVNKEDSDKDGLKVFIRPIGYFTDIRVLLKDMVGIFSRHFDAEDRVMIGQNAERTGTVVATHEDQVWVKLDDGGFWTGGANDIDAIPEHAELEPPPPRAHHD